MAGVLPNHEEEERVNGLVEVGRVEDIREENVKNVLVNSCSYKEFLACNPKEYDGKGGGVVHTQWIEKMEPVQDISYFSIDQKMKYTSGSFVGKALMWQNSQIRTLSREVAVSMSWNDFKFMMIEEFYPSHEIKDKNGRNDNKRIRTGNAFATTANPIRRENMGAWPKCTTYNFYHAPGGPCRTCFNCNRPCHFAKDCIFMPRNVNPVNVGNPTPAHGACYGCRSMDWLSNHKAEIIFHVKVVRIPLLDGRVRRVLGERPKEKAILLMSAKARDKKQEEIVVVRDFPENLNRNGNLVAVRAGGNVTRNNEKQYTELLEPIPEPYQVPQNANNVISEVSSMKQSGGTVEQRHKNVEETRVLYDSLYNNLAIEVKKVNTVNRKLRETNAELTTELVRYKNQEKCFEISQEKYDKLERCYQKSVYQEQCLTKKINALHLSSGKQITTLNEEISDLNKQLSMEKSTVSTLLEEKKKLKSDFKIREDELLDKQIQLENKIKELDNILVKTDQSIQMVHMLSPKPDSFYHTEQKMTLGYQNPFYLKQAQQKKQSLYNGKMLLEKHDPPVVHDSEETLQLSQENTHNWSSSAHQELHKIVKDEIFPIVNQVDARVQNFEIQFLKELAKFVRDFKSLIKEDDGSLAKHAAMELKIERLLRAVVSQDIMSVVQHNSVGDTSNLQTELERTKERFENYIIKKENEYAKLWNDWYKKCEECKYDKISYDKAYNDMQKKIERLQAQLGGLKGKSKDTSCVSDTLNPLPQKLENENVELKFQIQNYEKENAHLKTAYKNLFDSINVFEQKDTTCGTSANTKFVKQSILEKPPFFRPKLYVVTPLSKSTVFPKVGLAEIIIDEPNGHGNGGQDTTGEDMYVGYAANNAADTYANLIEGAAMVVDNMGTDKMDVNKTKTRKDECVVRKAKLVTLVEKEKNKQGENASGKRVAGKRNMAVQAGKVKKTRLMLKM
nr:reverse transcriptase domain-containing protein [Tanacetum cinerariifolium]